MSLAALLVLADGRLPAGGHAQSGGMEAAVASGSVRDVGSVRSFLDGRLRTAGLVAAGLAAAAARDCPGRPDPGGPDLGRPDLERLDAEADARTASPVLRQVSRRLGRQLVRAAAVAWPSPVYGLLGRSPHQPVALGVTAAVAGLGPVEAATAAAYASVSGPASAAVRLLGLDPLAVNGVVAALGPAMDDVATAAAAAAVQGPLPGLPATAAPLLDLMAEHHATWEVRLFAS